MSNGWSRTFHLQPSATHSTPPSAAISLYTTISSHSLPPATISHLTLHLQPSATHSTPPSAAISLYTTISSHLTLHHHQQPLTSTCNHQQPSHSTPPSAATHFHLQPSAAISLNTRCEQLDTGQVRWREVRVSDGVQSRLNPCLQRTNKRAQCRTYQIGQWIWQTLSRLVMRKARFWPPGAPKPLNGFRWHLEYIIGSRVCPHMQIHVALRQRGWSGRTREKHVLWFLNYTFLKIFCFILRLAPSAQKWTDFDDLYVIRHVSAQGCAFWGSRSYCSPFWGGEIPQKPRFWGRE